MQSQDNVSGSSMPITGVSNTEISINSLLVWLFYFEGHITIDDPKIKNFYGKSKDFLHPNIRPGQLYSTLKQIKKKKKNYLIKLCLHWKCINEKFIQILNSKRFDILELYIYADDVEIVEKMEAELSQKLKVKISMFFVKDINYLVDVAEREVELFTKHFRTNYNSICLTGDHKNNEIVKRYRFRLLSLINIKRSDQEKLHEDFKRFSELRFTEMKNIEANVDKSKYYNEVRRQSMFDRLLRDYEETIKTYKQKRAQIQQKAQRMEFDKQRKEKEMYEIKENLWLKMIRIYQYSGFFYQIINKNLRILKQESIQDWTVLAQPFSLMYQAIKNLHLRDREKDIQFYKKKEDNFVYREGRIRYSEIKDITKAMIKIQRKELDQMRNIENSLNGKRPQQSESKKLYMQFYGFLSTTTDLKVAIQRLQKQKNQTTLNTKLKTDYRCIFKINIKHNQNIYKPEYSHLLHGFYKFSKDIEGKEKEVLFNALNVFQFVRIKRKRIVEQQLVDYDGNDEDQNDEEDQNDVGQNEEEEEEEQNELVYQIELQFGPFYDFILDRNKTKLTAYEQNIKKAYCFCYNLIKKTDQFDIGNAHASLNKWQQSHNYYESKVKGNGANNSSKFSISRLDNKNYFLSMSQVCDNKGMTSKAAEYAKLSIECYKHMLLADQNKLFIRHMEKLFEMQKKIIDLWERVSDSLEMEKEANRQIMEIELLEKGRSHPSCLMRTSELNLKKGVIEFQKGDLKESKSMFQTCQKSIQSTLDKVKSLKQNDFTKQFYKNLICCSNYEFSCIWSYQKFQKKVMESLGFDQIQIKKEDFEKMKDKALDLSQYAEEAILEMTKALKDNNQYKKIIQRFKNAASINVDLNSSSSTAITEDIDVFEKSNNELLNIIREEISKIKRIDKQNNRQIYEEKLKKIKDFIKQYNERKKLTIYDGVENEEDDDFIQKFMKKEWENRQEEIMRKKNRIIAQTQNNFREELNAIKEQILQTINKMKQDCVSQYNPQLIILRNELLRTAWNSQNFELALQQIELIIAHGSVSGEQKHIQLAKAFKVKAKISLKSHNYQDAMKQAEQSLDCQMVLISKVHKKYVKNMLQKQKSKKTEDLKVHPVEGYSFSNLNHIPAQKISLVVSKDQFDHVKSIEMNGQFLETTLLRCKAKLYMVYQLKKKMINGQQRKQKHKLKQEVSHHMLSLKDIILQLHKVVEKRKSILKVDEIQSQFPQIYGLYKLIQSYDISNNITQLINEAFELFKESANLRNAMYVQANMGNLQMYCQLIFNFAQNKFIYQKLVDQKYFEQIQNHYFEIKDKSSVIWKVQKAKFMKEKYKPRDKEVQISNIEKDREQSKKFLMSAISTLVSLNDLSMAKQISYLQKQMKSYDRCYISKIEAKEEFPVEHNCSSQLQPEVHTKTTSQKSSLERRRQYLKKRDLKILSQLDQAIIQEDKEQEGMVEDESRIQKRQVWRKIRLPDEVSIDDISLQETSRINRKHRK